MMLYTQAKATNSKSGSSTPSSIRRFMSARVVRQAWCVRDGRRGGGGGYKLQDLENNWIIQVIDTGLQPVSTVPHPLVSSVHQAWTAWQFVPVCIQNA